MTYITRQQLATEMGICTKTLYRWLKRHHIEIEKGRMLSTKEAEEIKKKLGHGDQSQSKREK